MTTDSLLSAHLAVALDALMALRNEARLLLEHDPGDADVGLMCQTLRRQVAELLEVVDGYRRAAREPEPAALVHT